MQWRVWVGCVAWLVCVVAAHVPGKPPKKCCGLGQSGKRTEEDLLFGMSNVAEEKEHTEFSETHDGERCIMADDQCLSTAQMLEYDGIRTAQMRKLWTKNTLHFTVDGNFSARWASSIRKAFAELQEKTQNCVKLIELPAGQPRPKGVNVLRVMKGPKGPCYVDRTGMNPRWGGAQRMSLLDNFGCCNVPTVQHELMHVLGFEHEQKHPRREQFINVHYGNITEWGCHQYKKCMGCKPLTDFDYDSIMVYSSYMFQCNNGLTMTKKEDGSPIKRAKHMSPLDILKIKLAYGCKLTSSQEALYKKQTIYGAYQ